MVRKKNHNLLWYVKQARYYGIQFHSNPKPPEVFVLNKLCFIQNIVETISKQIFASSYQYGSSKPSLRAKFWNQDNLKIKPFDSCLCNLNILWHCH